VEIPIFAGRAAEAGKEPKGEFPKSTKKEKNFKKEENLGASVREP
jgi:hypothetical protein